MTPMPQMLKTEALILFAVVLLPLVLADSSGSGLVLVFCYNSETDPPFRDMIRFASNLSSSLSAMEGNGGLQFVPCTSLSELHEFLNLPQVVAVVISVVGPLDEELRTRLESMFSDGLGLVGFNHVCKKPFSGSLAERVFPIFGNRSARGKMTLVGKRWIRTRTYYRSAQHPITEGLPENFTLPDFEIVYCSRSDKKFSEGWPTPSRGIYTVLYTTTDRKSPYPGKLLPGAVAYENRGRSVSFPGFYATETKGVESFTNFVSNPTFTRLVYNAVKWVSEAGAKSSEERMSTFSAILEGFREELESTESNLESWRKARASGKLILQTLVVLCGAALTALTVVLCFRRQEGVES